MKQLFIFFLLQLSVTPLLGQSFEGKIIYIDTYTANNKSLSEKDLIERMGDRHEFLIKGGNYKAITNGKLLEWQLFNNKEKRFYSKTVGSPNAYWRDATVQKEPILKTVTNKKVTTVMGYVCDEIVITTRSEVYRFYFNTKFAAKPSDFSNHKYGYWQEFVELSKSIPLKLVVETHDITMSNVAIEIKAMKLDEAIFILPAGVSASKNPN